MSEQLLKKIIDELGSIYSNIPNETDLYNVENKLDTLIKLMESQNDISERIADKLEHIYQDMPNDNEISTYKMENHLEKISNKMDKTNSTLNDINYNVQN